MLKNYLVIEICIKCGDNTIDSLIKIIIVATAWHAVVKS